MGHTHNLILILIPTISFSLWTPYLISHSIFYFCHFLFLLRENVLRGFWFTEALAPHNSCFLLSLACRTLSFWKEFIKRGRADFWTNVVIGRLFNVWQAVTSFSYFFFFRSYLSKLYNVSIFSKAFKFFNIFFFSEQVSIEQLLFLFWAFFSFIFFTSALILL